MKTFKTLMVASAIAMTMSVQADWPDSDYQNVQLVNELFENGEMQSDVDVDRDMMWASNYEFHTGTVENNDADVDMIFYETAAIDQAELQFEIDFFGQN